MAKLVIATPYLRSGSLKKLAQELSHRLGYYVYRVSPERVHRRRAAQFHKGIDKIRQLQLFETQGVNCPKWVTSRNELDQLECKTIVARRLTNSSEGKGIVLFNKEEQAPVAPLYTEYIPKKKEFRVYVWNNRVIDVTEKRKRRGVEERDTRIRNTANGYVFCRDNVVEPEGLRELALQAVNALGRSYGGVDVIWNEYRGKCYVLEVNSCPGMEGTTITKFADAILGELT